VNLRRLRLFGIVSGDVGIALAILTFVVRLESIVRLVAVILIVAGVVMLFRWSALKANVAQNDGTGPHSGNSRSCLECLRAFASEMHFSLIDLLGAAER
jgi:hypothetical protein